MSAHIANKGSTQCFYNPSKAAVSMLAKVLAMEWKELGISVNTICPGYVEYVRPSHNPQLSYLIFVRLLAPT
jgi:NAD(P)-dependent dehydrogenase (short-subunit alcohol dehydrogenase family)